MLRQEAQTMVFLQSELQILTYMKCTAILPLTHTHTKANSTLDRLLPLADWLLFPTPLLSCHWFLHFLECTECQGVPEQSAQKQQCGDCSSVVKFTLLGVALVHQLNLKGFCVSCLQLEVFVHFPYNFNYVCVHF
jgi:hypothetical protein